ncbi:MAG: hypothetical protein Q7S27_02140 [Nanoarchaeota archaeon]|nr:hypothetical protein [Nanoarchaeota archaeon]
MEKRGISHIEVILSFLIFIGFIMFALYFFSPFEGSRLIESSLEYAFIDLIKNTSVELKIYPVVIEGDTKNKAENIIEIEIPENDNELNLRVENYLGEPIPSRRSSTDLKLIRVKLEDSIFDNFDGKGFINMKFSKDITSYSPPEDLNGAIIDQSSGKMYNIGSGNVIKAISEKKLIDLKTLYEISPEDYNNIKKSFNLPSRVNFGFAMVYDGGQKIETTKEIPPGVEVFSKKKRIEILNLGGKIEFGEIIVKVW